MTGLSTALSGYYYRTLIFGSEGKDRDSRNTKRHESSVSGDPRDGGREQRNGPDLSSSRIPRGGESLGTPGPPPLSPFDVDKMTIEA